MSVWRKIQWMIIFGVLSTFSLFMISGMSITYADEYNGFVKDSISHLPSGRLVYFSDAQGWFRHQQFVCSISSSQLSSIESSYSVKTETYHSKHQSFTVAKVSVGRGQSAKGIEQVVGRHLTQDCKVQTSHSILYIFTVPELS